MPLLLFFLSFCPWFPIDLTIKLKNTKLKINATTFHFYNNTRLLPHDWIFWVCLLAGEVPEPLSAIAVILFGIIYSGMICVAKPKNKCVKNMAVVANNGFTPLVLMNSVTIILFLIALGMLL